MLEDRERRNASAFPGMVRVVGDTPAQKSTAAEVFKGVQGMPKDNQHVSSA